MSLKAKFCSQCAAPIEIRQIEDRPRMVCSKCDTIHYQNPLPVAASVVLNENREILLVKRARRPHQGQWCLPIGFAELGETIAGAARRELKEETGIQGKPIAQLDVDSSHSDFYGDLLVVSFEMQFIDGEPIAGDDADDVGWFPLDELPLLAFSSNAKAIEACIRLHEEEWAIKDSFTKMQAGDETVLLSDDLVALVRDSADSVAARWVKDVQSNASAPNYARVDPKELHANAAMALSQFTEWLHNTGTDDDINEFYQQIGRSRRAMGFGHQEILSGLTLLRKHVWTWARDNGVWEKPIDVYRVLELNRRIVLFFDKALYQMALGFAGDE